MKKLKHKFILVLFAVLEILLSSCTKKEIQEKKEFHRIACLSPSGAEILFSLGVGDKVVARTDFCDWPEDVKKIPSVGGFDGKTLSIESILSFEPDFVYAASGMHDFLKNQLESMGISVYLSDVKNIDSLIEEIKYISEITGSEENGKILVEDFMMNLEKVSVKSTGKKAYYEVWNVPFVSCGKSSFINDILIRAGYENIFSDVHDAYPIVNQEEIILRNPDVIFIPDANGVPVEELKNRHGWKNIDAVKNGNVFLVDADVFSRPSPRIVNAIELIKCKF